MADGMEEEIRNIMDERREQSVRYYFQINESRYRREPRGRSDSLGKNDRAITRYLYTRYLAVHAIIRGAHRLTDD